MANEQLITVAGRLTADTDLRFTPSGVGVANFTIAFTPQKFDKNSSEWKDGTTTFWRCAAWNQGKLTRAENVANLLKKGDAVVARGVLETRNWEDKEGNKRSSIELNVQSIGKDLTFHGQAYAGNGSSETANRSNGGFGGSSTQEDPWATPGVSNSGGSWGDGGDNAPPS